MQTLTLTDTHSQTCIHRHKCTFADTHIFTDIRTHSQTHILAGTHIHSDTHTHADTHIHSEIRVCHRAEGNAARHHACVPSCSELPDPSPLHTRAHLLLYRPYLLHTHWVLGSAPGPVRHFLCPHLGAVPAPGLLTSTAWRRAADWLWRQPSASQQAAGGRQQQRPLLAGSLQAHLGEQRQWWLLLQPSPLPTGTASGLGVSRLPAPPPGQAQLGAARGQLKAGAGREACEPIRREGIQRILGMEL